MKDNKQKAIEQLHLAIDEINEFPSTRSELVNDYLTEAMYHIKKVQPTANPLNIQVIGDEIENKSIEMYTMGGLRFSGISKEDAIKVLEKYGYDAKPPF